MSHTGIAGLWIILGVGYTGCGLTWLWLTQLWVTWGLGYPSHGITILLTTVY